MSRVSPSRIVAFSGLVALLIVGTAHCSAKSYVNCTGLCESVLPCNDSYDQCITFCTDIQNRCESVGRQAVFLAYVACTTDAGFSCNTGDGGDAGDASDAGRKADGGDGGDAGQPLANAPCGFEQAELVQCEFGDAGDASLDVPDGFYDPGLDCPDAGSCLACCEAAYPNGKRQYAEAVTDCACGEHGKCNVACATEACLPVKDGAPRPQPDAGGPCDMCLSTVLDEQSPDAGVCVKPVTKQCNGQLQCAGYANCVSQTGCTN
jgi:hypothetical protein